MDSALWHYLRLDNTALQGGADLTASQNEKRLLVPRWTPSSCISVGTRAGCSDGILGSTVVAAVIGCLRSLDPSTAPRLCQAALFQRAASAAVLHRPLALLLAHKLH
jgi:hypothetical protein